MVCERSSLLLHLNRHIDKEVACVYDGKIFSESIGVFQR